MFINFSFSQIWLKTEKNIAGKLPENSRQKIAPQRVKKDVTHATDWKLHKRMYKKQIRNDCDVISS